MRAVAHGDHEAQIQRLLPAVLTHAQVNDVGLGSRQRGRHARQHTLAVDHGDDDADLERAHRLVGPGHGDEAFGVLVLQAARHRAFVGVHHQAFAAAQVAQHAVAGDRAAAGGVFDRDVLGAIQNDGALRQVLVRGVARVGQQQRVGLHAFGRQQRDQALGDHVRAALAETYVGHHLLARAVAGKAQQLVPQRLVGGLLAERLPQALGAQRLRQQLFAQFARFVLRQAFQMAANLAARAAGAHKAEPRRVGRGDGRCDDLDDVAVGQFAAQRHLLTIDLGADGVVAHVAVDGVGKVDHRGALRQRQDLALGREDVHLVGHQVDADVLPELGGVARFVLDVEQRLQPARAEFFGRRLVFPALPGLVEPVRGHAGFGHQVHRLGADLELDVDAGRPDQRGVQRLVAVDLGDGDVVLEAPRHRLVQLVQHAQRRVAADDVGQDHAHAVQVVHLGEGQVLFVHLAVDGVKRFLAPDDVGVEPRVGQRRGHVVLHFLDQVAPALARLVHRLGQHAVAPRLQVTKGQVLQLAVGFVQAQAVGDGRVDVERLGADAAPFGARHVAHGAHVVQAVGQLDQNHAHVARHGQQHLAEGLGLAFLARAELQLVQLGEAVHQFGHRGAELLHQVGLGDAAVFHRVVQQRGHEGVRVQLPFGHLRGHGDGVGDVGLAAVAHLAQVGGVGKAVGAAHQVDVGRVQIVQLGLERGKAGRSRIRGGHRALDDGHEGSHKALI